MGGNCTQIVQTHDHHHTNHVAPKSLQVKQRCESIAIGGRNSPERIMNRMHALSLNVNDRRVLILILHRVQGSLRNSSKVLDSGHLGEREGEKEREGVRD